jgi:phage-related protein
MVTLIQQNHSLNPEGHFYVYELDFSTALNPTPVTLYLSPYRNGTENIVLDGKTYVHTSMAISDFTVEAGGKIMSPVLTVMANGPTDPLMKLVASVKKDADGRLPDIRGMKLRRIRSMARFLDENRDGPFTEDMFSEITLDCDGLDKRNKLEISFKFSPTRGIEGVNDRANRTLSPNVCNLKYRVYNPTTGGFAYTPEADGGCPWGQAQHASEYPTVPNFGEPYYDAADELTTDPAKDRCNRFLPACLKRFGTAGNFPFSAKIMPTGDQC